MARIILVDDDPISSTLVSNLLFDGGHAIGWIEEGVRALATMRARPPHLAVLDCAMPGLSGLDLLRAMRADARLVGVPVVMLTGRQSERDERLAYEAGADDYLRKPVDPDQLLGRIDALLMRGNAARAAG